MHLAERRGDLTLARQALSQIRSAFETFRDAGHVPHAASCEGSLAEAQAVIERLRS